MRKIHFKDAENKVVSMGGRWAGKKGIVKDVQIANKNVTGRLTELPTGANIWIRMTTSDPEADYMVTVLSKKETEALYNAIDFSKILDTVSINGGFSIGADPEVFVVNGKDEIIPAFTFLPSKAEGNPFWDGFQAEFTTQKHYCLAFLVDEVRSHLLTILRKAKTIDETAKLTYKSVLDIPNKIMKVANKEHAMLGCAPSQNIYNIPAIKVDDPYALPIRFAGCHFHLGGVQSKHILTAVEGIDELIGIISVSLFQQMEDERRRRYYGRAGEYRTPSHGLEYRVLSSAVLSHPALFHFCYDLTRASIGLKDAHIPNFWRTKGFSISDIINDYDIPAAQKLIAQNKSALIALFAKLYRNLDPKHLDALYNLTMKGAINMLPVNNMANNWRLNPHQAWSTHSEGKNCCVYKLEFEEV